MSRVAVMGSGSWGTAFAMILADAGGDVVMWSRDADLARRHCERRADRDFDIAAAAGTTEHGIAAADDEDVGIHGRGLRAYVGGHVRVLVSGGAFAASPGCQTLSR